MSISFFASALEEVELPLACDPVLQAANNPLDLASYSVEGDRGRLVVPPGATLARLRPLSASEIQACGVEAGTGSHLGAIVEGEVEEAGRAARVEAWKAAEGRLEPEDRRLFNAWRDEGRDEDHPGAPVAHRVIAEVADAVRRRRAEAVDALPPSSRQAYQAHQAWEVRRDDAFLRRAWLGMSGWTDEGGAPVPQGRLLECLALVRPMTLQREVRAELVQHVMRLSTLEPLGKALSPSGSTEGIPRRSTSGPATIASSGGSDAPEATAAGAA